MNYDIELGVKISIFTSYFTHAYMQKHPTITTTIWYLLQCLLESTLNLQTSFVKGRQKPPIAPLEPICLYGPALASYSSTWIDMKLIITGASGFVGTELLKQSLCIPAIKTVIALTRRPLVIQAESRSDADHSKLRNIVVEGYDQLEIGVCAKSDHPWGNRTVAITPSKSTLYDWNEICRVCYESPLAGLRAMLEARGSLTANTENLTPFRFIYMSGAKTERDQSKTPSFKPEYSLLRVCQLFPPSPFSVRLQHWLRLGRTETAVLALAKEHESQLDACIVKPGLIIAPNNFLKMAVACALWWTVSLPSIGVSEISAAMLKQSLSGFEKDTLENHDLLRLGESEL
ncbi:uncharacterized protein CLUP02_04731 [Colletotrichum lupini]|uniref:Uncharacterized protein n=1 Tax=Colletotrichum lupini TaxID=145971 RepID=A0A9Q8WDZ7_9PEZI|nr:uncharacterized protein CLUP02_04731 [Colletotrichum lupini]UQC79252.1 hypothetical protein CLUP02_04731 [Colletotrichum lupini]